MYRQHVVETRKRLLYTWHGENLEQGPIYLTVYCNSSTQSEFGTMQLVPFLFFSYFSSAHLFLSLSICMYTAGVFELRCSLCVQVEISRPAFDGSWNRGLCGGTIIDSNHILTAAHCLTKGRAIVKAKNVKGGNLHNFSNTNFVVVENCTFQI